MRSLCGTATSKVLALSTGVIALAAVAGPSATAAASADSMSWPGYLHGPRHSSAAPGATAITTATAKTIVKKWTWTAPGGIPGGSPTTAGGLIFIGANNGSIFALNESSGTVRWHKDLGGAPCNGRGSTSTGTVTADPVTGASTLYIAGADNHLYALDPTTGSTRWRQVVGGTTKSFYTWGSPTVANGRVYMAISSACDDTTHGGAAVYDQHTGTQLGSYRTDSGAGPGTGVPTVYTSPVVSGSDVYVTTGDSAGDPTGQDSDAIVRLNPATLARKEAWLLPSPTANSDYNASPAFFDRRTATGTQTLVGACNKDGVYRAFKLDDLAAGPVWTRRVGLDSQSQPEMLRFCGGSSAYDGANNALLVGADQSSLADPVLGSAYRLDPATGAVVWRRGLPAGPVIGSLSVDGAGVVAAPTYDFAGGVGKVYLLSEATGTVLRTISAAGPVFAQPVFSNGRLLIAAGSTLTSWG